MVHRAINVVLGTLLLLAGGLKLYGLDVLPVSQNAILLQPRYQFVAAEWEIVLGLWLLSGRYPVGVWVAVLLTFLAFAIISFYHGLIGQVSCGCFGVLKASPWHALAVDVAALLLLGVARPPFRRQRPVFGGGRRMIVRVSGVAAGVAAICAVVAGLGSVAVGSVDATLAYLRREQVSLLQEVVSVGSGEPLESLETSIEIVNRTNQPLRILGGTSDCSCVVTANLPLSLAPGETRRISVKVRLPNSPGAFTRKAWLWTDCDQDPRISFDIIGRVNLSSKNKAGEPAE